MKVLLFARSIVRADIGPLCERIRVLLDGSDPDLVLCDVGAVVEADAVIVDALARLQLTAKRLGSGVLVVHACSELRELVTLMGLSDVVRLGPELGVEALGEPEQREETGGVQEEADPGDPPA